MRLQALKNGGFDFCEGDALVIDLFLWPISGLQFADMKSSSLLRTTAEEVRTYLKWEGSSNERL